MKLVPYRPQSAEKWNFCPLTPPLFPCSAWHLHTWLWHLSGHTFMAYAKVAHMAAECGRWHLWCGAVPGPKLDLMHARQGNSVLYRTVAHLLRTFSSGKDAHCQMLCPHQLCLSLDTTLLFIKGIFDSHWLTLLDFLISQK